MPPYGRSGTDQTTIAREGWSHLTNEVGRRRRVLAACTFAGAMVVVPILCLRTAPNARQPAAHEVAGADASAELAARQVASRANRCSQRDDLPKVVLYAN